MDSNDYAISLSIVYRFILVNCLRSKSIFKDHFSRQEEGQVCLLLESKDLWLELDSKLFAINEGIRHQCVHSNLLLFFSNSWLHIFEQRLKVKSLLQQSNVLLLLLYHHSILNSSLLGCPRHCLPSNNFLLHFLLSFQYSNSQNWMNELIME